jgi:hypothetical protein
MESGHVGKSLEANPGQTPFYFLYPSTGSRCCVLTQSSWKACSLLCWAGWKVTRCTAIWISPVELCRALLLVGWDIYTWDILLVLLRSLGRQGSGERRTENSGVRHILAWIPALQLTSCVTFSKCLYFSESCV